MNKCCFVKNLSSTVNTMLSEYPSYGEESITDYLLWQLQKLKPDFKAHGFSKSAESKHGADYEWWFIFDEGSIGFRVQAKKLSAKTQKNYNALTYKSGTSSQFALLKMVSQRKGLVPVYSFYYSSNGSEISANCCKIETCNGIYVEALYNLESFRKDRFKCTSAEILKLSLPFYCFFCCDNVSNFDGFKRFGGCKPEPSKRLNLSRHHSAIMLYEF